MTVIIGKKAPDLEVVLPGEQKISLESFRGRPLVLIFIRHLM